MFMYNTTIYDRKGNMINDVTMFQMRVGRVFRRWLNLALYRIRHEWQEGMDFVAPFVPFVYLCHP